MKILLNLKLTIALLLISVMVTGCSDNKNENLETLLKDKANTLTAQEKVKELLIMTEGNYTQLACILNASPSTLKRLYQGETFATPKAEKEISKHYNYFLVERNSIENFKANCISYAWYHHVKNFMSTWWFWVLVVIFLFFMFIIIADITDYEFGCMPFILAFFPTVYVIIWIINYFAGSPDYGAVQDNFVNTINTLWESQI